MKTSLPTGRVCVLAVAVFAVAGLGAGTARAAAPDATSTCIGYAVAHHENAAHNGNSCVTLPATPTQKWSVTLNGPVSYPILADGKVFVATASSSSYGGSLYALDATTGRVIWGPVPLSGTYYWFALAYGNGRVFVNNFDGTVAAYETKSGREDWAQQTDYFSGEPVFYKGVVYLQGAGPVFALSAQTGAILWSTSQLDGDGSSLATDDTGVFVFAGCTHYLLSLSTGATVWSTNDGCSGGGGGTVYLDVATSRAFEDNLVVRTSDGHTLGTYAGTPAFLGTKGYFVSGTTLFSENVQTLTPIYSVTLPSRSVTSPVIAGSTLYVGAADAKVYGIDTATGAVTWSHALPGVPGGGAQYSSPVSDIAVGEGLLVVPSANVLTAFG